MGLDRRDDDSDINQKVTEGRLGKAYKDINSEVTASLKLKKPIAKISQSVAFILNEDKTRNNEHEQIAYQYLTAKVYENRNLLGKAVVSASSALPLAGGTITGAINFGSQNMTNVDIDSGTIDGCNITVGSGKTLELRDAAAVNMGDVAASSFTSATFSVGSDIQHTGDTNNKIAFGTDTQDLQTGGSSRLDISDSGIRLGGTGARVTSITDDDSLGTSDTVLCTQGNVKAYVDARKSVLRNQSIYVNDSPFIQNSLYFGHSTGNQPLNWNDPQAIGGDPMTVSSFNISDDDQKWGMIIPYNISKIEILCGLRPGGTHTDQFSLVLYTASRITGNVTAITLTRVAQNGVNFDGSGRYTNNDLTHTADIDAGTMIYVGVGTNTSSPVAKNAPGYMSITITQR